MHVEVGAAQQLLYLVFRQKRICYGTFLQSPCIVDCRKGCLGSRLEHLWPWHEQDMSGFQYKLVWLLIRFDYGEQDKGVCPVTGEQHKGTCPVTGRQPQPRRVAVLPVYHVVQTECLLLYLGLVQSRFLMGSVVWTPYPHVASVGRTVYVVTIWVSD